MASKYNMEGRPLLPRPTVVSTRQPWETSISKVEVVETPTGTAYFHQDLKKAIIVVPNPKFWHLRGKRILEICNRLMESYGFGAISSEK